MPDLGTLKRLDPRSAWLSEAADFTPWLARHLGALAEALGLDLELVDREAAVGDFSADIVARDLAGDRLVVIENQLEPTDHSHLGQLITYAAGLEAEVVVWLSREFREEHRQAIDWLNRGHGTSTAFFGVVLDLLQIDDSQPAAQFRLVAAPNDWSRRSRARSVAEGLSERALAYQRFFQVLVDEMREQHRFTNARHAQALNWQSFAGGRSGYLYAAVFGRGGQVRAELYIDTGDADQNADAFDALHAQRDTIEREFGAPLDWQALEGKRACRIAASRAGSIEGSPEAQEELRAWFVDSLLRLRKVFGPRISR